MSNLRVFEFAKEIGFETLSLMDKLKEWEIPVKNHMATLDEQTIELIRTKLQDEKKAKSPAPKAAKKKVAKKETGEEKPVKKKTATKVTAPSMTKKTADAKKSAEPKRTVIRRKAEDIQMQAQLLQEEQKAQAAADAEALLQAENESTQVGSDDSTAAPEAVSASAVAKAPEALKPRVARNIVGRMDLTRVKPPPGSYGNRSGTSSAGGSGSTGGGAGGGMNSPSSIGGGGTRNIRTGFVAAPMDPFFEAEHEARKRKQEAEELEKEKKRKAKAEEENIIFTATDFRKREVVFQPKKKKLPNSVSKKTQITTPKAHKRVVKMENTITVQDFAQQMGIKTSQIVSKLMKDGVMVTPNSEIDFDTATIIAPEFNFEVQNVYKSAQDMINESVQVNPEDIMLRNPIVTVMGHVDHGKTSLLDAIRKADVASREAGGITQHIGAYKVKLDSGKEITFIDTPGHEAFTAMRARGANVTDIVVLVVAADDGVMPQTVEALNHAKSAGVPIIVAVNKIDKPGSNPDRIKQQLSEHELLPEEWGGTTIFQPVSALKKEGITELLEQILLVAEVQELKANPHRPATGAVIESRVEKGRGVVATLLVKEGTLKTQQYIVAGTASGRIRSMQNERGQKLDEVKPGEPVEILGLDKAPLAGDTFDIVDSEKTAQEVAAKRISDDSKLKETPNSKMSLESIFSKMQSGDVKELPIILKADVAGSLEAIKGMLDKTSTAEVKVKVLHTAVGGITESDVLLADTSKGIVIGFNVRPDSSAQSLAKQKGVEIKSYSIIYELVDDMKKALTGLLEPEYKEQVLGSAEVRQTFTVPKLGMIAGCMVKDGKITRSAMCRLIREGRVIYTGKLVSLKRFKDDAREVAQGFECGIGIENYNDIKVGDVIEAYERQEIQRTL